MSIKDLFATPIYQAPLLSARKLRSLLKDLKEACFEVCRFDEAGRKWSAQNYPHGFTSYSSWDNLHQRLSVFADLKLELDRHAKTFAHTLEWNGKERGFHLTQLWVNIMNEGAHHDWHLHPLSCISGTFYVDTPGRSSPLLFEDPRMAMKMSDPILRPTSKKFAHQAIQPRSGEIVLFESWLKHKVPRQNGTKPRISLSFNYSWS